MNFEFLRREEIIWLFLIVAIFFSLRLPAVHSPYHQDEYKWVQYSHPEIIPPGTVPHPPLAEFIYVNSFGSFIGDDNFRFIPLIFSSINIFLLFYLLKNIFDNTKDSTKAKRIAFWGLSLVVVSYYSILSSLMVDVDGQVMPTFFLIMATGYYRLRKIDFQFSIFNFQKSKWLFLLILGAVGGFLVKMSGVLPLIAFALDFAIIKGAFSNKKRLLKFLGLGVLLGFSVLITLLLSKLIFPFFPIGKSLTYWSHFANSSSFLDRGWLQTFIQFAKAILYLSPALILPIFFVDREIWRKTRPFFLFIFIGLIFYLFAFDFSIGALDRYFQFLIIPLVIVCAAIFEEYFSDKGSKIKINDVILVLLITTGIFVLQFFSHSVFPLYPKTEWLNMVLHLKWNFLFSFTGGSGPLPFYVSFLFMALIWICCALFAIFAFMQKGIRKKALFAILILGLTYNAVFIEEYVYGKINGSTRNLLQNAVGFIKNNPNIENILVYNDNGGGEIKETGKYERRIYAAPQFEETYKEFLKNFSGHILYINIPKIGDNTFYSNYINTCQSIYEQKDKYIIAKIFYCTNL